MILRPLQTVLDQYKRPISGAQIYIYNPDGSLATLTSNGTIPLTQPVVTDAFGSYSYWANTAYYTEETWFGGKKLWVEANVAVGTPGADLTLRTDLAASTGAALVGYSGGTLKSNLDSVNASVLNIGTKNEGTLPSGGVSLTPFVINKSAVGASDGLGDWRALEEIANFTGAFGATQINGRNTQHNLLHTAGTVTAAVAWQGYSALGVPSTPTTTGNVGTIRGIEYHISHTGTGTVTDLMAIYLPGPDLNVGVGTVTNVYNYRSGDLTLGAGSRITGQAYGFFGANCSTNSVPILATYGSEMSWDNTGKRRHFNFTGGASSTTAGRVRIGDNTEPTEFLEVAGNAIFTGSIKYGGGTALTKATVYTPTITPASVAAATVAEQTFTVTGLTTADKVIVNPPAIANATGIAGARVSAADTLAIRFVNPTAGALTPSSGIFTVLAFRS